MNKLAVLALVLAPLILAPGCVPLGGCSAYTGGGDVVYQRSEQPIIPGPSFTDTLIECDNGGFVATIEGESLDGHYGNPTGLGSNGGLAFTQIANADGTISTVGLTGGAWTAVTLDTVTLDHANTMCTALASEAWWSAPTDAVPAATEVALPNAPTQPLVLCPDGSMYVIDAAGVHTGGYSLADGALDATTTTLAITGTLQASGNVIVENAAGNSSTSWQPIAVDANATTFCETGRAPVVMGGAL